jgi:hypothetical protein
MGGLLLPPGIIYDEEVGGKPGGGFPGDKFK